MTEIVFSMPDVARLVMQFTNASTDELSVFGLDLFDESLYPEGQFVDLNGQTEAEVREQ